MNKRRLLLFSVFALLHITTSERNFIDGRCCNYSSRSLFSDTRFSTYGTHRVQRFLPEIQQLNNPEKYSNLNKRDTDVTRLSRRRQIEYIKQQGRNNEIRETLERYRKILNSPTEDIQGRQNFRQIIRERSNALRHNRFDTIRGEDRRNIRMLSLSLNDNRINDVTGNRFESIDVNRYNHNDRDAQIRDTRDNGKEVSRNFPELVQRDTQRNTNRNSMRNDLERVVRLERNVRKITSGRVNANDRNSGLGRIQNLDEELSQNKLLRKINNVRTDNRMNSNDNERLSVNNNRISIREAKTSNSRSERRVRTENTQTRAINELATGTRNYKLELRETSRVQRDHHTGNRYESGRTQSDHRRSFDQFDINRERESVRSLSRRSSEEKLESRDRSNDATIQLERKNANKNVRYNRDTNENVISEEIREQSNLSPDRNREYINSKRYMERNMVDSRISNTNRRSEGSDNRDRNENRLSIRRSHMERAVEKDNKRTIKRSLQSEKISEIQRSTNDVSDRMSRRNHEEFRYSPEIRENYNSRQMFREIYVRSAAERGERLQSKNIREIIDNRVNNINIDRILENQRRLTVRQDENIITSRNNRNIMTARSGIQIARTNIEEDFRQRSRSLSYDRQLTGSRLDIRTDDERRQIRKVDDVIRQSKSINYERRQTRNLEERRPTRNIDDERKQARNIDDERKQARNIADERRQARIVDEKRQARNIDDERKQARNIADERRQARIVDEKRQARNIDDERKQARNIADERRQARIVDERRQARNIDDERRQAKIVAERRQARNIDNERKQARNIADERRQARIVDERRQARNIDDERQQARIVAERRQARNIDNERKQARNIADERRQARIVDERRQARNIDDERKQARYIDEERQQARIVDERKQARNIDDERRQTRKLDESRSTRNIDDKRTQTGNMDNERRQTRNVDEKRQNRIAEDRSVNMVKVVDERRDSMRHLSENRRSMMTYKIQYENEIFGMKWQYLFYALQLVYLCSVFMKIPNGYTENKQKRLSNWFTTTEYIKID